MRILAAVDLSTYSQCVLDAIAERRWDSGTEIKLTTVVEQYADDPVRVHGGYHRIDYKPSIDDPSHPHKQLAQLSMSLRQLVGSQNTNVSIDPVIKMGHPSDEILLLAKDWRADLIVVGTHGRSGLEKLMLGSVSTSILHHAMSHVQIAKSVPKSVNTNVYKILVPVDHSPFARAAVEWLVKQHWIKPTEIHLLTAIPEISQLCVNFTGESNPEQAAIMLGEIQSQKAETLKALKSLADEVQLRTGASSVVCSAIAGDPIDVITNAARDGQADLILIGSHGRTGLTRVLLGSVSSAVAQNSQFAVEVVKPNAPRNWS